MKKIVANYAANYNGWSITVDGVWDADVEGDLVEITHSSTTTDGEYFYTDLLVVHLNAAKKVLSDHYGSDDITIDIDHTST